MLDIQSSGGEYQAERYSGRIQQSISALSPFTLSPINSSKRLRLESLLPSAAGVPGVTITTSNGKTLIDNLTLDDSSGPGRFSVGLTFSASSDGSIPNFTLDVGESITIETTSISNIVITYSYSYGD